MKDMLGREQPVTAEEALSRLMAALHARPAREVSVGLEEALGLICSLDVVSAEDLPGFARSTVDGYAVVAADTFGSTETMPAYLTLTAEEVFMGERAGFTLARGSACRIPTGGMLPAGADAVVMFEHVQQADKTLIEVMRPAVPSENVIQAGEDVRAGEVVLRRGRRIRPADLGACAGIGVTSLHCYERPLVAIISTGDEIIPADQRPSAGQVRDINSYVLSGMIREAGGRAERRGIFTDDYDGIRRVIEDAMATADAIAVSGGTSVGTKDMLSRVIDDIGSPGVVFHGVTLKPGKPMIGGVVKGIPIFGLPGHPAAVGICFELFIRPVLDRLSGIAQDTRLPERIVVEARLAKNVASAFGREEHVRVQLEARDDGLWALPVLGKSGLISTLVKADGTFVIPLNSGGVERGETVRVRLF